MKKSYREAKTLEEAIIDLYLNVKIRKQEEIEHFDENSSEKEKERLKKANPFTIIDYIKSSIRILIDLNVQEKLQEREKETEGNMRSFNFDEDQTNEYEKLLRKLEADIRTYIKIEHQLKLHSESLQQRVEDLEKHLEDVKNKNKLLKEQITKFKSSTISSSDEHVNDLKKEIVRLKQLVQTYEEHNLKIPQLEKKLRTQKTKYEKEMKEMENDFQSQIAALNRRRDPSSKSISRQGDDIDRVNYNYIPDSSALSHKSSIRSRSHSPDIKLPMTQRKKEIDYISSKIEQYKKGIDKKINENIKNIVDDLRGVKKFDKLEKFEKLNITSQNNKSTIQTIDSSKTSTEKKNQSIKPMTRNTSRLISSEKEKSLDKISKIPLNHKTIHAMKDKMKNCPTSRLPPTLKEPLTPDSENKNLPKAKNSSFHTINKDNSVSNPNIILNQNGVPCYNNIHIYTGGPIKTNDINLRQYIVNKANRKTNSFSHNVSAHGRSSSNSGH